MLAAHVYRPLITGAGLAMGEESDGRKIEKKMEKNLTATDELRGF
jgi:hypothetical protein